MGRSTNKLSALSVKKTLPPGLYGDGGGLYLQVSQQMTKAWVFRFMMSGRARKMGLGAVSLKPDDKNITLADARSMATDARSLIVRGIDPIEDRNARKAAQAVEKAKGLSFKDCAERYIAAHESGWKSPKHGPQWRATLKTYAYPTIGALPVAAIDVGLVLKVLEPIWKDKTVTAARVRGRIESVLSWAKARGYRQGENPATWRGHLDQLLPSPRQVSPVEHHPALPYAELPGFMAKLRKREGIGARALEFTILTVARTGDTIGAKWKEIDRAEKLWTVPAARVKGKKGARKRDHAIPLPNRAIDLLKALPTEGDFIFPGGKEGSGLSSGAMSELLDRMGYPPDVATVHGFRSAFKDWCSEQTAYPNELSEMALAHTVSDKVEAAYRRGDMRAKRQRLMADWAAYCGGKAIGGNNVVKIGARK
jgi:integrase